MLKGSFRIMSVFQHACACVCSGSVGLVGPLLLPLCSHMLSLLPFILLDVQHLQHYLSGPVRLCHIWLCLAMSGHVTSGPVWPCLAMSPLAMSGHVTSGSVWPHRGSTSSVEGVPH